MIEPPQRTEVPVTRYTFPLLSRATAGDFALPNVAGARSVLDKAAWMSRYPAPTVKMSYWLL
jgi:hypothetical protein